MDVRISQRAAALKPSATMAVTDKAKALRAQGLDVIAFAAGEPDFDTPVHIKQAAIDAINGGDTKYPSPGIGITPLRSAVQQYFRTHSKLDYDLSQICINVGAKDTLFLAFQALLDPGDEVIVPAPYWVSYPEQVKLAGGEMRAVHPDGDQAGAITAGQIEKALTGRTKALVLNSPCNPSGAVIANSELERIADLLRDTDVTVLSDEIYHRLLFTEEPYVSFAKLPRMFERTLTVNGLSKTYAMTGWRLGFAGGPEPLIKAIGRLQGQSTTGPASFAQTAAVTALTGDQSCVDQMRETYRRRCAMMCERLNAIDGFECPMPGGAFYCFPNVRGAMHRLNLPDSLVFAEYLLDKAHVAVVPGPPFGCPDHIRLSAATSDANIEEGLDRIADALGE